MNVLKTSLLILFYTLLVQIGYTQRHLSFDKLYSVQVSFLTSQVEFTPSEAEKFWPIFRSSEEQKFNLQNEKKSLEQQPKNESEAEAHFKKWQQIENDLYNLEASFWDQLSSFLSYQKILEIHKAREDFRKKVLNRAMQRQRRRNY